MSASPADEEEVADSDRDEILSILEEAIHDVRARTISREVETPEDERLLINWYRTLGSLTGQYRKLRKDRDLDEMEEELELLQEVTGINEREGHR